MIVERICQCCKTPFKAKSADVKRGWAKFCSKSCKAKRQEQKTGQYKQYLKNNDDTIDFEDGSWDAHKDSY